jgi:hypothetical protein
MLSSITPLGERGRGRRWGVTTGAYLAGSVAAGAAVGWALGLIGLAVTSVAAPDPGSLLVVAAGLSLAGFAADLGLGGLRLPGPRRQVNEDWLDQFRGWVVGLGWGAQLGTGVVTIVTSSTIYLAWVLAALSAAPAAGAAIGVAFGLARAVPLLGMAGVANPGPAGRRPRAAGPAGPGRRPGRDLAAGPGGRRAGGAGGQHMTTWG